LAGALGVLYATRPARAQATIPEVDLQWRAPPGCPTRESVLADAKRLLGARALRGRVTATAEATRAQDGTWVGRLDVATPDGEIHRTFEAESCEALASVAAVMIAVAADEGPAPTAPASLASQAGTPKVQPGAAATTVAAPATSARASSGGSPRASSQLLVELGAGLDGDLFPRPVAGGELGVGWALRLPAWRFRALVSSAVFASVSSRATNGTELGTFVRGYARAAVCASYVAGGLEVGPCAGGEADYVQVIDASGPAGFERNLTGRGWGTFVASVPLVVNVAQRFGIFARADGLVPVERPEFRVRLDGQPGAIVYKPPTVAFGAALGVEARFF
jgi:hypothetical protein